MNYLFELIAFYDWIDTCELSCSARHLWYVLMQIANRAKWQQPLIVALKTFESKTGMSRKMIMQARAELLRVGRIGWQPRRGNQAAAYWIIPFSDGERAQFVRSAALRESETSFKDPQEGPQEGSQEGPQTEPQTGHINKLNKTKRNETKQNEEIDARFEAFWAAYPRKVARQDAINAWRKLAPDQPLAERMIRAVDTQSRSSQWTRDDGQFIPYPDTWISRRRWEDVTEMPRCPPEPALDTGANPFQRRQE